MLLDKIISRMDALATTAMGMVTALAWNTAFTQFFDSHPVIKRYGPWAYALIVTIIAVLYVTIMNKLKTTGIKTINDTVNDIVHKKHRIRTQEEEHR